MVRQKCSGIRRSYLDSTYSPSHKLKTDNTKALAVDNCFFCEKID